MVPNEKVSVLQQIEKNLNIKQFLDEVQNDIMNYQNQVYVICRNQRLKKITHTQGFDNL